MVAFAQPQDPSQDPDAIKKALLAKLFGSGPIPAPGATPAAPGTAQPISLPGTPPALSPPATTQPNASSPPATPLSAALAAQPAKPIMPGDQSTNPILSAEEFAKQNPAAPHTPYQAPDWKHRLLMGIFSGMQDFGADKTSGTKMLTDYINNIEQKTEEEKNYPLTAANTAKTKYGDYLAQQKGPIDLEHLRATIADTQSQTRLRNAQAIAAGQPKPEKNPQQMHAEALQDALARGVDPATDTKVRQIEDAIQRIQKEPTPKTENDFEQYYAHSLKDTGKPDSAANRLAAHKEWEIRPVQPGASDARNDSRMDKSYQYNNSALDRVATPVDQALQRLGRLNDAIAQNTPQADALIAPELLSVMAGGAGSGLRMNEAEISRIVGGRSKWESLKASANQWSLDPSKANSITPEQRQQIRTLTKTVQEKLNAKQRIVDDARNALIEGHDPTEHRRVVAESKKKLDAIDAGGSESHGNGGTFDASKLTNFHTNGNQRIGFDGQQWVDATTGQPVQ